MEAEIQKRRILKRFIKFNKSYTVVTIASCYRKKMVQTGNWSNAVFAFKLVVSLRGNLTISIILISFQGNVTSNL